MKKKNLRKVLKETKERKEQLLVEQTLVRDRILMIFESEENILNFKNLPKSKREKLAWKLVNEINFLSDRGILNEQLGDFLGKIFGSSLNSVVETLIEPLLNSILSGLGLTGYFKDFLVSFISSHPSDFAKALKDCKALTTLIANSLAEAVAMMIMNEKGMTGSFYVFLRNALGGAVKDIGFVNKIEGYIGDMVCSGFSKLSGNAENVFKKLKGDITGGLSSLAPAAAGK